MDSITSRYKIGKCRVCGSIIPLYRTSQGHKEKVMYTCIPHTIAVDSERVCDGSWEFPAMDDMVIVTDKTSAGNTSKVTECTASRFSLKKVSSPKPEMEKVDG